MGDARTAVVGVTGSIAAYKACELVRLFVKGGWDVHVVMTPGAMEFVTPLTFRTLSRNPVQSAMFSDPLSWKPDHVSLAEAADVLVIAPATANTLAKIAHGVADNLLTSIALATRAPVWAAPAMNDGMWGNAATRANLALLGERGMKFVAPGAGELACGSVGPGRMAEPGEIYEAVNSTFK